MSSSKDAIYDSLTTSSKDAIYNSLMSSSKDAIRLHPKMQ
jgi:hypothetical protein